MGLKPDHLGSVFEGLLDPPLAFGANCGVGAPDLLAALMRMAEAGGGAPLVAKANCGIPQIRGEHVHYSGTPELMAAYAVLAADAGARIVGGCCGTSVEHVAAMRAALDGYTPGDFPTIDRLVGELGPLVSAPAGEERSRERRRRRG